MTIKFGAGTQTLGFLFIALKLAGVIGWSWWWVTAPFWLPFAIAFAVLTAFGSLWLLSMIVRAVRS